MMPTQGLFLITVLYLVQRWVLSLFNRQTSVEPLLIGEGEREGRLIHRTVKITKTLEGTPTDVTFHSRPFDDNGMGLDEGYEPWGEFIPDCDRPMKVEEFFPNSPWVRLQFFETGHFIPLENPELFTDHLVKAMETS